MLTKEAQVGKRIKPKRGKANKTPDSVKERLYKRDGYKCVGCGNAVTHLTPHHIDVTGSGEANHGLYNLVSLGAYCCHEKIHHSAPKELRLKIFEYMVDLYPESIEHLYEHLIGKYERKGF